VSEMVYEFPELQGVMGRYYALEAGEDAKVADAIRDHYKPQGPSDTVPTDPVGIAVALADKLDTLVGFWAIDEKPTGSKDPFALRRAALGVVRIVLENGVRIELRETLSLLVFTTAINAHISLEGDYPTGEHGMLRVGDFQARSEGGDTIRVDGYPSQMIAEDLLSFFADRLKQYLKDQGQRHDLIDAVFALGEDDLVLITKRVEALGAFLETEDGANLLAGYKRAANILKAEEKKAGAAFEGEVDPKLLQTAEEKALFAAIGESRGEADHALKAENFAEAMQALAKLRAPVDNFFENTVVNADDSEVRQNRLLILVAIRDGLQRVADFGQISG